MCNCGTDVSHVHIVYVDNSLHSTFQCLCVAGLALEAHPHTHTHTHTHAHPHTHTHTRTPRTLNIAGGVFDCDLETCNSMNPFSLPSDSLYGGSKHILYIYTCEYRHACIYIRKGWMCSF